jgi:hypothetical protein
MQVNAVFLILFILDMYKILLSILLEFELCDIHVLHS